MAISITSVVGNGSPIPSDITVTGTVTDCERIEVTSSCYSGNQQFFLNVQPGQWSITIPNTKRCQCGDQIVVTARCVLGVPASDTFGPKPLPCGECPTITVDPPSVGTSCVAGKRTVTLTVHVSQAATATAVLQWDFGDGSLGTAFVVTGSTPAAGVSQTHDYVAPSAGSTSFTATLLVTLPQGCPSVTVTVTVPACPAGPCPDITDITFAEGPCDAQGRRSITATASVTGGTPGAYWWSWDGGPSVSGGATSPAQTFAGGTTHTVQLTIITGQQCVDQFTKTVNVTACPGTTTTTTTSTTTTSTTTTSTTTTSTTTTSTTPPPPPRGGCLCMLLLVLAMAFIAVAAVALLAWGCGGFVNAALLTLAIAAAVIGIALLVFWVFLCRDCAAIRFLMTTFGLLVAAMIILAVILFLFGQIPCAIGALIVAGFFALLALLLAALGRAVRCF